MYPLLLPLVGIASVLTIPLDITQLPDFGTVIQQLANEFSSSMVGTLLAIHTAAVAIARAAYVTVIIVGVLLYFTHLHRRLGRELITGGIFLAVLSEFVFPALTKV